MQNGIETRTWQKVRFLLPLFSSLKGILFKYGQYDARKLPKVASIAKTAANNPCAFLGMLNDFQKMYKNKKETKSR